MLNDYANSRGELVMKHIVKSRERNTCKGQIDNHSKHKDFRSRPFFIKKDLLKKPGQDH